jgi:hypothetical protein
VYVCVCARVCARACLCGAFVGLCVLCWNENKVNGGGSLVMDGCDDKERCATKRNSGCAAMETSKPCWEIKGVLCGGRLT